MDPCNSNKSNLEQNAYNSAEYEELKELQNTEGLQVWGTRQEVLENEALKELEYFTNLVESNRNDCSKQNLQTESDNTNTEKTVSKDILDINSYIQKQEALKKWKECRNLQNTTKRHRITAEIDRNNRKRKSEKINRKELKKCTKIETVTKDQTVIEKDNSSGNESDYQPDSDYDLEDSDDHDYTVKKYSRKQNISIIKERNIDKVIDDGSIECYKSRLEGYYKEIEAMEKNVLDQVEIATGLKLPCDIWNSLYSYQKKGVKWLWNIHQGRTGGLLGDEMGLGKTVQIIVFLHALRYSRVVSGSYTGLGPTLIVCPATVLHQWVKHFHEWAPEFRVAVLHQSGSYAGKNKNRLIKEINKESGILLSTYQGILKYKGFLIESDWHYLILDEGHKIRNPDAKVSVCVKQIHTPHRIVLTGSPMQNNLQELWSLFDFLNPGMLGTLPAFVQHFVQPIVQGGYMNSTPMQEATALSVATALKDMITPFLLRRVKDEVKDAISLPEKSEQVLFCSLSDEQKELYKGFLMSEHVSGIIGRGKRNWYSDNQMRANMLVAITTLRKICNHPDLYLGEFEENSHIFDLDQTNARVEDRFGHYKRSGKMRVVSALLKIWKKQAHRVLLFTQGCSMMTVFEEFLVQNEYKYLKMDGSTSVASRQPLITKFNEDDSYFVFLLTTRVGGVGVNLTGANRVIIYDPDWNPATDTQARERAWRIGQHKEVTVYRLLSAGTIEEKIYQRQVWKQLLSNKVLIDPKSQKFFRTCDLHDLFSFQETADNLPETSTIFRHSQVHISKEKPSIKEKDNFSRGAHFSEEKIEQMRLLAQKIAKNIVTHESVKPEEPKSSYQLKLEEERRQKLKEKQYLLRKLTPSELRLYNRKKLEKSDDDVANKLDDSDTALSFSRALEVSEKTALLYHRKDKKHVVEKSKKKKKKQDKEKIVDESGKIDGEIVEGLVKIEAKKIRKNRSLESQQNSVTSQDDYVLEKLFSKKGGVQMALKHDVIVQSGSSNSRNSLKLRYEAKQKADSALQALRKSRINDWRW